MPTADLVLHNANVLTLDPDLPRASLVAARGNVIVYVGDEAQRTQLTGRRTRVIDCQGGTLLPGFHDAHCHLLGLAAQRTGVDCAPPAVTSLGDLQAAITRRAQQTPAGQWIRAHSYHEFDLAERRHPTRHDLDGAAPDHPVRLAHRSGHAHVLNTLGLQAAGITHDTPDPVAGVIERDEQGEPTGLLLEMRDFLDGVTLPPSEGEIRAAMRGVGQELLSLGITSVQDASAGNDLDRWGILQRMKLEEVLSPHLTMLPGLRHLPQFHRAGIPFGTTKQGVRLGHAKVMLTLTTGALYPPLDELTQQVRQAQARGFPVAIHAVEAEAVQAAAQALLEANRQAPAPPLHHRVEHASECPPATLAALQQAGASVVTQPAFLYANGDRYLQEVPQDIQPWLYRIGSLVRALPCVAASSDAPVGPLDPLLGLYAAVTRRSRDGQVLSPEEGVSVTEALALYTRNAAYVAHEEDNKGSVTPGKLADLVVLDQDPTKMEPEELRQVRVRLTVVDGAVVWQV